MQEVLGVVPLPCVTLICKLWRQEQAGASHKGERNTSQPTLLNPPPSHDLSNIRHTDFVVYVRVVVALELTPIALIPKNLN